MAGEPSAYDPSNGAGRGRGPRPGEEATRCRREDDMERMTGLDAGFLYMETPTLHMHTLKIAVVDPASVPGGYSFGRFKEVLDERLHLLPPFRRRIVDVPAKIHHPVWIEDAAFDLSDHVRRVGCPAPGGMAEF